MGSAAGNETRRIPGYQEPTQGIQGPRQDLLGFLDQYGPDITRIFLEPAEGNRPAEVVIQRRVPGHESDELAVGMRRFRAPLEQVAQARTWFDANSANPFGVPYPERINHAIVGPALQRVEIAIEESQA
jgi:hypothetical protein